MKRRKLFGLFGLGAITAIGGGSIWLSLPRDHPLLAFDLALETLGGLDLSSIQHTGDWELARIFNHLRQGVDFSIDGYPEEKSPLFQKTVGKLAFNVFQARGKMSHALNEVIPGEQVATTNLMTAEQARAELIKSLSAFQDHGGALQPHFAFGTLSKEQYAIAHVMHINNHMDELNVG